VALKPSGVNTSLFGCNIGQRYAKSQPTKIGGAIPSASPVGSVLGISTAAQRIFPVMFDESESDAAAYRGVSRLIRGIVLGRRPKGVVETG